MASKKNKKLVVLTVPTAKTMRNRRKRQKQKSNKMTIARAARTTPRKMGKRWPSTKDGANFLRAALDPFSDIALRSIGVPDTLGALTLKHVNTMEITVKPSASGNIIFTLIPSVSTPLLVRDGLYQSINIPTANGSTPNGNTILPVLDPAAILTATGVIPGIAWPTWVEAFGTDKGFGPYSYRSQRVVSQGLEWKFTGTDLTNQGICTSAALDAYVIEGYEEFTSAPLPIFGFASNVQFSERCDINNLIKTESELSNQPRFVQLSMKDAQGAGGMSVMVSSEEGYIMKPYNPDMLLLGATTKVSTLTAGAPFPAPIIVTYGQSTTIAGQAIGFPIVPWQNLQPIGYAFTGLDPSISIVIKLKQYVEATLQVQSPFQQFSDKSPTEDQQALCIVADVQKTIPVMVPVTMNSFGDWWRKIFGVISSAGNIVGGIGIPMVSQVATGVAGMADILASFADL